MKKSFISAIYFLSLIATALTMHQAFAQRGPSVEEVTEVSIEDDQAAAQNGQVPVGFDFAEKKVSKWPVMIRTRIPANIETKTSSPGYSYIGPLIFLLALPIALWIIIANKTKSSESDHKVEYFPKTYQFKPFKNNQEAKDVDGDDQDFPKAS